MDKAIVITYNNTHLFQKPIPVWDPDYTKTSTTRFRPIPLVDDYNRESWRLYWNNPTIAPEEKQFQNVLIIKDGEPDCIPLSTNINLKCKKRMFCFPMDFGELTIDGLIDTGALSVKWNSGKFDFSLHNLLSRNAPSKCSDQGRKWTIRDP